MFDFFQVVDFNKNCRLSNTGFSFLRSGDYENIIGVEYIKEFENSKLCYLEREKTEKNCFSKNGINIFIFGTVFSNNLLFDKLNLEPKIIYANLIFDLLKKCKDDFVNFIKGSFVIIIYDENKNEIKLISDRLNVLPVYYALKNGYLIVSSSVKMILESGLVSENLNKKALIQQLIFDYVLGSNTYYEDINRIENGKIYEFYKNEKIERTYWSVEELYNDNLIPKSEALEMLSTQLHQNTNLYCSDSEKVLVSLTGGFDGRANLALLDKNVDDYLCYSYGMPGSKQVEVPKMIADRLNINYTPVLLDDDYEKAHDECTLEAINFSNGNAPIIRSNYPYAYKKLNSYSKTILTGLFGSEVMRPLHNLGIMMNDYTEKLFLSDTPEQTLKEIIVDLKNKNYLRNSIIDEKENELIEEIISEYFNKYNNYDKVLRFFFFIIKEGVRKYFSQEIQIERVYVTTRFPFFDDDFVSIMFKTPFAGMYNGFLGKSKIKRRRGQLLYAYIFKRFKPELGKIVLDRGYKPDDLLKPFPINYLYLLNGVRKNNAYKKAKGNDTFDSVKWTKNFIGNTLANTKDRTDVFGNGLIESFKSGVYSNDLLKYSHFISVYKYLNSF